ncbi:MAG: protein BatD [Chlamydiae bacterium]|nr:protein BatD [Chlamydiota bacterium]
MIVFFIFWTGYAGSSDQDVIDATVDRHRIPLNESTVLTITVTGSNIEKPIIPDLQGLVAHSAGQSQNITIINGKMASSASYTYILEPQSLGKFTVPPIQVKQDQKVYQTSQIEIEVVQAVEEKGGGPSHRRPLPMGEVPASREEEKAQNLIFTRAEVNLNEVYVGQQIMFSFKLYRKVNFLGQPAYAPPNFSGFWVETIPSEKTYYEVVDGEKYLVSELRTALFPTTSGDLTIGPSELKCQIPSGRRRSASSFFDDDPFKFFDSDPFQMFEGRRLNLKTDPIVVKVKELPKEGQPPDFSGAVGEFNMKADVDSPKVKAGEPITLSITLEGEGNIGTLTEPHLDFGDAFRIYDSGHSEDIKKDQDPIHGKKVVKKVVIPTREGHHEIPGVSFSFFSPEKKSYQTLRTSVIPIQVEKGKGDLSPQLSLKEETKNDFKMLQKDIQFIKTDFNAFTHRQRVPRSKMMVASLGFPLFFLMISFLVWLRRNFVARNFEGVMVQRSYRSALRKLKALRRYRGDKNANEFYAGIEQVLTDYLSKKLGLALQGYRWDEIKIQLEKRKADESLLKLMEEMFEKSNLGRFTPMEKSGLAQEEILKELKNILAQLEKKI